jgi:hypothetical protein
MTSPLPDASSPWSLDARVLSAPASTLRALAASSTTRRAQWLGKLFLLAFVFGTTTSALVSGRFSVRSIADGMLAFAFVPVAEWLAFAAVYWHATRATRLRHARPSGSQATSSHAASSSREATQSAATTGAATSLPPATPLLPFGRAFDLFLLGNSPWLLWMITVSAVGTIVPPRASGWFLLPALFGCALPALWAAWIDFHFFREVFQRSRFADALNDLIINRIICWTATIGYFFGIAIWYEIVPLVHEHITAWAGAR